MASRDVKRVVPAAKASMPKVEPRAFGESDNDVEYRSVVEVLSEGISVIQADGTITLLNESAAQLVGVRKEDALGHKLLDLRWHAIQESGEFYPHTEHPALVTLRTGMPVRNAIIGVYQQDRSVRWLSVNTHPLREEMDTAPYAVAVSFTNITDRLQAERALRDSEARFRRLSDATDDAIIISVNGMCVDVNHSFCKLFGYEAHEVIGRPVFLLAVPEMQNDVRSRIAHNIEGSYMTMGLHKDATRIPLQVTSRMAESNGRTERVDVLRDLREQDALDRMKGEFIATVSHELRTPLTSIRGAIGLMQSETAGELPAKVQQLLQIARTNTDRLMRLINNILDLEKIDAGDVELRPSEIELGELAQSVLQSLQSTANVKRVKLVKEVLTHGPFSSDWDRLFQVLENLLSNAIKFSPDEAQVILRIASASNDGVLFEVIDRGIGIQPEMIDRLFRRFIQIDSSDTRKPGGAGLGLAIARGIVLKLGGRVNVESEPGIRTRFWFTLPRVLEKA